MVRNFSKFAASIQGTKNLKKNTNNEASTMTGSILGDKGAMDFMYYGVCMYKNYVIPIGTISVCWGNSKKLTAGARMLMAGE